MISASTIGTQVVNMCECLGHEFMETMGSGAIRHRVELMKGLAVSS